MNTQQKPELTEEQKAAIEEDRAELSAVHDELGALLTRLGNLGVKAADDTIAARSLRGVHLVRNLRTELGQAL